MKAAAKTILDAAKLNNPNFNLKVLRSTYPENYDEQSKKQMEEYGIKEVQVCIVGGVTDSSKFIFAILLDPKSIVSPYDLRDWLYRLIITYCSDDLDKSHPYFDKFGLRDKSQKKKAGLMSFDECTKDPVSTLEDPVAFGIYTNPKKYVEQSFSSYKNIENYKNRNMKHKKVFQEEMRKLL